MLIQSKSRTLVWTDKRIKTLKDAFITPSFRKVLFISVEYLRRESNLEQPAEDTIHIDAKEIMLFGKEQHVMPS